MDGVICMIRKTFVLRTRYLLLQIWFIENFLSSKYQSSSNPIFYKAHGGHSELNF